MTPTRDDLIANIVRLLERHNSNHETVEGLAEKIYALLPLLEPVGEAEIAEIEAQYKVDAGGVHKTPDGAYIYTSEWRDKTATRSFTNLGKVLAYIKSRAAQQRTPGTVERCARCSAVDEFNNPVSNQAKTCAAALCPIRAKGAST